jgi:ComF family protein
MDIALPDACAACGRADVAADAMCTQCNIDLLALVSLPYCRRCGSTLGPHIAPRDDGCFLCPDPLPRFERVVRLGPYRAPLRKVIREMKYHRYEAMRRRLGRLLAQAATAALPATAAGGADFDVVVPVPMHWRRRLARGYDHAGSLAGAVARELDLPLGRELVRVRHTPPQVSLPRSRRIENVRGAFTAAGGPTLGGADVLLVDDVITTGATANEAARTLLAAGAARVVLAVVAKAEPPRAYAARLQRGG